MEINKIHKQFFKERRKWIEGKGRGVVGPPLRSSSRSPIGIGRVSTNLIASTTPSIPFPCFSRAEVEPGCSSSRIPMALMRKYPRRLCCSRDAPRVIGPAKRLNNISGDAASSLTAGSSETRRARASSASWIGRSEARGQGRGKGRVESNLNKEIIFQ